MTHKSEAYKISPVKYYLNNNSLDYHFTKDGNHIRTQKYVFQPLILTDI